MGDDLKFIDFHQLQIENKKPVKDSDGRNKKLLALKLTTGKTVQNLNNLKNKLNGAQKESTKIDKDIREKNENLEKTKDDIGKAEKEEKKFNMENRRLKAQQKRTKGMPEPIDYVKQKTNAQELRVAIKNWERKIEIAEVAAKRAKQILRQR